MLFFELFPAFMAIVAIAAGVGLFLVDRRARQAPTMNGEVEPADGGS